jgi:hypothetical protein
MASVKLPDGKQLEIEPGERARDVAEKIGKRLTRDAVVAKLISMLRLTVGEISRWLRETPPRAWRCSGIRRRTRWHRP